MIVAILDIMSYITVGLLTIPAWINFLVQSLSGLATSIGT